ncbi:MAG TPA: hypothetical protein VKF36_15665 [Syntrophorhabdales bacterium]|nr:hypothetical protein [Syntrophorhabdales bacterium]
MQEKLETFAVFASFILSELFDSFPVLSGLNKHAAFEKAALDFEGLGAAQRELSTRESYRQLFSGLLESKNPYLTLDQRHELEKTLSREEGLTKDDELRNRITQLQGMREELEQIFDGTVRFLEAEGYIRAHGDEGKWQLTEKGFAHLNKRFTGSSIASSEDTLISRIKEQFSNPSKLAAQSLIHIIGAMAGHVL